MRVSGRRLSPHRGTPVHAASFLLERLIVLDRELLAQHSELKRIWLHELFHFVWWRLGNPCRWSWERLLLSETHRGELGWSAEWRKRLLTPQDRDTRSARWREYCAESFCDTGAWVTQGSPEHPEATLAVRARRARIAWWRNAIRYNSLGRNNP